jgi:biopolymer transport protein ExbB/TolQ
VEPLLNTIKNDGPSDNWSLIIIFFIIGVVFMKGCYEIFRALQNLSHVPNDELNSRARDTNVLPSDPLSVVAAKTLRSAYMDYRSNPQGSYSVAFLQDATRQLAEHLFESKFIRPISMCSNLLPPIGFIGTVLGMIFIFFGGGNLSDDLNSSGLGVALFTTLSALILFVVLEGSKILLSKRVHKAIEQGLAVDFDENKIIKHKGIRNSA